MSPMIPGSPESPPPVIIFQAPSKISVNQKYNNNTPVGSSGTNAMPNYNLQKN